MSISRKSAADLSGSENLVAKDDGNGLAALATAGTDAIIGVIKDGGRYSGDAVSIYAPGEEGWVTIGAAVVAGTKLTATTGSKAITTTTDTNNYFGIAQEDGAADGDKIRFLAAPGMIAG